MFQQSEKKRASSQVPCQREKFSGQWRSNWRANRCMSTKSAIPFSSDARSAQVFASIFEENPKCFAIFLEGIAQNHNLNLYLCRSPTFRQKCAPHFNCWMKWPWFECSSVRMGVGLFGNGRRRKEPGINSQEFWSPLKPNDLKVKRTPNTIWHHLVVAVFYLSLFFDTHTKFSDKCFRCAASYSRTKKRKWFAYDHIFHVQHSEWLCCIYLDFYLRVWASK